MLVLVKICRGKGRRMVGGGSTVLRTLFGALLLMGVIWFLIVGILANPAAKTTTTVMVPSTGNHKRLKSTGEVRHTVHQDLNLIYVSKRKVPNGPDPIHNREQIKALGKEQDHFNYIGRASKSRQPPGRA